MTVLDLFVPLYAFEQRQFAVQQPDNMCLEGAVCVQPDPFLTSLLAIVTTAVLALFVGITLGYLREARAACEEERKRTRAEHDAFVAFAEQIADMEPTVTTQHAVAQPAGRSVPRLEDGPPNGRLRAVREAYRDTVMAVPHYEEDYDESLPENIRAEFGEGLATAITHGDDYTPQLQQALLQATEEARHRRAEFLTALDREAESIDDAEDELSELQERLEATGTTGSFDELRAAWRHLNELETTCERFVAERQEAVHEYRPHGLRGRAFHEYVYQKLPVQYPVLAEAAALADRIRTRRREVLSKLTASG